MKADSLASRQLNAFDVVGSYRGREAFVGRRGLVGMSWVERERQREREKEGEAD